MDQEELLEKRQRRWCGIIFCGVIPVVLFFLAIKADCLVYAINDDTGMRSMAIGSYSGKPDAHLNYPSYLWGIIVSSLYTIFPALDWYGILLWGLPIIGLCLLMNQLQAKMRGLKNKIVCVLLSLTIILLVLGGDLMRLQWTVSAALCGVSGCLIYYLGNGKQSANFQALFLLGCSLMIRKHSFFMVMVLFGMLFVYREINELWDRAEKCFRNNQLRPFLKRNLWLVGLAIFFAITSITTDRAYSSEEWVSYKTYSNKRSLLYDYQSIPVWDDAKDFYEANGYSQQTVSMLKSYLIGFLDDIDAEDFIAIREYAKDQKGSMIDQIKATLISLTRLRDNVYIESICVLLFGTVVLLVYKLHKRAWKDVFLLVTSSLACGAMAFLLEMKGKLPNRVLIIILLIQMASVLVILCNSVVQNKEGAVLISKKQKIAVVFLAFCFVVVLMAQQKDMYQGMVALRSSNADARRIDEYYISHPDNFYVLADSKGTASTRNFAFVNEYPTPSNTIGTIGWGIRNPLWYDKLALIGAESPTEAIFQDNVYLCTYSEDRLALVVEYLRSVGKNVQAECVDVFEYSAGQAPLLVYKIHAT